MADLPLTKLISILHPAVWVFWPDQSASSWEQRVCDIDCETHQYQMRHRIAVYSSSVHFAANDGLRKDAISMVALC
ncbi:uncharacterized [Tachysurus ichikawai]